MNNGQQKKQRRISLKWKWALFTSLGVLVIILAFSTLLFNRFTNVLQQQERTYVTETLNAVNNRLSPNQNELSKGIVSQTLTSVSSSAKTAGKSDQKNSNNIFADSLDVNMSKDNLALCIYTPSGKQLFKSQNTATPFVPSKKQNIVLSNSNGHEVMIGYQPIFSKSNGKLIGYAQVTNKLTSYQATVHKLLVILFVLVLLLVVIAFILAYILAAWLLRPIDKIQQTMTTISNKPDSDARVPDLGTNDELSELGDMFNAMLDRTQGFMDQQQQFVGDVSHELRTPVAVIQGHMEMLLRWGKDDPEVLNESLKASLQETKRMKSLVSEMLDLSRAEQIHIHYNNEYTKVNDVADQVYNDFKMIHPDFTFIYDDDTDKDIYVQIYRNHLEQLLVILMDNAIKYSTKRKEVHLSMSTMVNTVSLAVQDFGEGISQEDKNKIFNRFYRVDKARSRDKGGNGLGLSIAHRLVEVYHGSITVESSLGHGSIFQINLPIIQDLDQFKKDHHINEQEDSDEPEPEGLPEDNPKPKGIK